MALPTGAIRRGACCLSLRFFAPAASGRSVFLLPAAEPQARSPRGLPALPFPFSARRADAFSGPSWLLPPARFYSSNDPESGGRRRKQVVLFKAIPNPLMWFRTRFLFFLVRVYFKEESNAHEFIEATKQAFAYVSGLISQCRYDLLEELVSKEVIQVLKEKLASLSENHRKALAADMDEIMYSAMGDVGIFYDDSGRKFVSILMRFWYLSSVDLPDEMPEVAKVFHIGFGNETTREPKRLLTANYEFQRELKQGMKPDWTIVRIEHPRLLE